MADLRSAAFDFADGFLLAPLVRLAGIEFSGYTLVAGVPEIRAKCGRTSAAYLDPSDFGCAALLRLGLIHGCCNVLLRVPRRFVVTRIDNHFMVSREKGLGQIVRQIEFGVQPGRFLVVRRLLLSNLRSSPVLNVFEIQELLGLTLTVPPIQEPGISIAVQVLFHPNSVDSVGSTICEV